MPLTCKKKNDNNNNNKWKLHWIWVIITSGPEGLLYEIRIKLNEQESGWRKKTWVSEEPDSGNKTYRRKLVTQRPIQRSFQLSLLFLIYFYSTLTSVTIIQ